MVGQAVLRSLVRGRWIALAAIASVRLLHLGTAGFGYLMAAAGTGALTAIALTARLVGSRRTTSWYAVGPVLCGAPIAMISFATKPEEAIPLMIVWGIGLSLSDAAGQALLNRVVPAGDIAQATGIMESGKLLF